MAIADYARFVARFSALALIVATATLPASAKGGRPRLDSELRQALNRNASSQLDVIITALPGRSNEVRAKLGSKGHGVTGNHVSINAISATVDAADLADFDSDPSVASVSINADVRAHEVASDDDALVASGTLRSMVGAATTASGYGVGVAVIDSGILDRPDLHDQIRAFYDFTIDGSPKAVRATDPYGHGTHIAATIASSGQESDLKFQGIAPSVRLIGLRVLDSTGGGKTSTVINALTFATANKVGLGIDIINLSLGHPIYESAATDPLVRAVEAAVHAGIVVVVSAGNFGANLTTGEIGYGGITSPGNSPSAITVGADNTRGTVGRSDDFVTRLQLSRPHVGRWIRKTRCRCSGPSPDRRHE